MNNYINIACGLLDILLRDNESSEEAFNFIFDLVNKNFERQKSFYNQYTTSTNGFLLNFCQALIKILFEKFSLNKQEENINFSTPYNVNIFYYVKEIDIFFGALSQQNLNLQKFERINSSEANEFLKDQSNKINEKNFNKITKLFFSIHALLSYFLKNLETEYTNVLQQLSKLFGMGLYNDPKS